MVVDSDLVPEAVVEEVPGVVRAGAAAPAAAEAYGKPANRAPQQVAERGRAPARGRVVEEVAQVGPVAELETVAAVEAASGAVDQVEAVEAASAAVDQVEVAEAASAPVDQVAAAEEEELEVGELAPGLVQPANRASG